MPCVAATAKSRGREHHAVAIVNFASVGPSTTALPGGLLRFSEAGVNWRAGLHLSLVLRHPDIALREWLSLLATHCNSTNERDPGPVTTHVCFRGTQGILTYIGEDKRQPVHS